MAGAVRFAGETIGLEAAADLSALQFRFMLVTTGSKINKNTAATQLQLGILQNKPISGQIGDVRVLGGSKLQVDANAVDIAVGDFLTADANGKGVKTTTTGNFVRAIALEPATNDGEIISVMLVGPFKI